MHPHTSLLVASVAALLSACTAALPDPTGSSAPPVETDTSGDPCAPAVDPGGSVDPLATRGEVERVATGFQFVEGPVWDCVNQELLFSDIPANAIHAIGLDDAVRVFRADSGNSNGLLFDTQGRLLAAEHGGRRVSRTLADGTVETVVDSFEGKRLNSPNDLAVRADGTVWFTDPPYGLGGQPPDLDFMGLFRIDPSGTLHVEVRGALSERPNGVVLSPDASRLYLADSEAGTVVLYDVAEDGSLSGRRAFTDETGVADGMTVDIQGNVYVTSTSGVVVFAPDGARLGVIPIPEQPSNATFGGPDRRTLWVTARTGVYRVKLGLPGAG